MIRNSVIDNYHEWHEKIGSLMMMPNAGGSFSLFGPRQRSVAPGIVFVIPMCS